MILEKVVAKRLLDHMTHNSFHETLQSEYKPAHSTETTPLGVKNDFLQAIDKRQCGMLILLHLSAPFDTVDHSVLLQRLSHRLNVKGTDFNSFDSYLSHRTQSVVVSDESFHPFPLSCGIQQGSVLGPILFTLYTLPLGDIIRRYGVYFHLYAEDTKLYIFFKPTRSVFIASKSLLHQCVAGIRMWMRQNFLKLNSDKTEVILIGIWQHLAKLQDFQAELSLTMGDTSVLPVDKARNLGVIFDSNLNLEAHINNICCVSYFHIRNIGQIRSYLSQADIETLVHALISSCLHQLNSLLYGLPDMLLKILQRVQNAAACLVTGAKLHDHITPVLARLHWLPVKQRITFKILLLTYKCSHCAAPAYLTELIQLYEPRQSLSSQGQLLLRPVTASMSYSDRSFSIAAPLLWNSLPLEIRSFKYVISF